MKGWVEGTLADLQRVLGNLLNALRYAPAMHGFERQGFQDEQVKGSLQQIVGLSSGFNGLRHLPLDNRQDEIQIQPLLSIVKGTKYTQ